MFMLRSLFPIALGFGVISALADDTVPPDRDEHTLMLLRVPADGSALRDVAGEAPVEMKGGRIVADGTHEELMRAVPAYSEVLMRAVAAESQADEETPRPAGAVGLMPTATGGEVA